MDHINEVTPEEVEEMIEKENDVIIDVREDDEVAQGMIEGAKHIKLEKIPDSLQELDKNKHYVMVCRSGRRSMSAAAFMDEHGFHVSSMAGGMLDWKGEVVV
ncbi:rhodanese-like domain-containing protein [Virgibacillus siamensis]|uniref:rhodanese-like domain-containing protein n=1 Tax=Virgibacillus siamensis TaxID=480071 RepID=UPI0009854BE5|nr:rhodanese-like domain-containing protein [Virgibacillus siamensis]